MEKFKNDFEFLNTDLRGKYTHITILSTELSNSFLKKGINAIRIQYGMFDSSMPQFCVMPMKGSREIKQLKMIFNKDDIRGIIEHTLRDYTVLVSDRRLDEMIEMYEA